MDDQSSKVFHDTLVPHPHFIQVPLPLPIPSENYPSSIIPTLTFEE